MIPRAHRYLAALFVAAAVAVLAALALSSVGHAESAPSERARATAQQAIDQAGGRLAGAAAGEPVLVHSFGAKRPVYYLVPAQKDGRTLGLVGVTPDGRSWEWYTDDYTGDRFPQVSQAQAGRVLHEGSSGPPEMVIGPDNKLYWTPPKGGPMLSAHDPGSVISASRVGTRATPSDKVDLVGGSGTSDATVQPSSGYTATASSLPTAKNLNVPYYQQPNAYYCGPAALDMVFGYYYPPIKSQYDVGHVMNAHDWGSWSGAYASDLMRSGNFSYISTAVMDSSLRGYKERSIGYAALEKYWWNPDSSDPDYPYRYRDLKSFIAAGYPVIMLTWYDTSYQTGHFRVLRGYDDSKDVFIVNDPWYTDPYQGPNAYFKQEFLVDNLWEYSYMWATVVTPWKVGVTAPSSVSAGSPFTVKATITYPGPGVLAGMKQVSSAQALLQAPSGFEISSPTKYLSITSSGTTQTVYWTVTPPTSYSGSAWASVTAKAMYSGSSHSYNSYSDWIGGWGQDKFSVGTGDTVAPSSWFLARRYTNVTSGFPVSWGGSDSQSGIAYYQVQWLRNGVWVDWIRSASVKSGWFGRSGSPVALQPNTIYRLRMRSVDRAGNASSWVYRNSTVDTTAPTRWAWSPTYSTNSTSLKQFPVEWGGSDNLSGVDHYQVQWASGGSWHNWLASTTSKSAWFGTNGSPTPPAAGLSYALRVRAVDRAGNVSSWRWIQTSVPADDTTPGYTSGWGWVSNSDYGHYLGTLHFTKKARSSVRYSFWGRTVAWIGDFGPDKGRAAVYVDGRYVATVDTYSPSYRNRVVVYQKTLGTRSASHTIEIRVLGTKNSRSTGYRVDVDGIGVRR